MMKIVSSSAPFYIKGNGKLNPFPAAKSKLYRGLQGKENPQLSRKTMAELVGISENGIKYHLNRLKKQGRIIHVGPTKKGYWKIEA